MFALTPEQQDIRKAAREFAEGEIRPIARELDEREELDPAIWKKAAELGFLAVFVPEEYGGAGYGFLEEALIIEEFARVDTGVAQSLQASYFGSQLLLLYGTEEQKKRYLPAVCRGEMRMGVAITEPDAGSDVASISTRAERRGDHYVISGHEIFITNATVADFLIVACVTNPEAPKKHERLSLIIVETSCPGYEATKLKGKLSIRCSDTGEVALKEVVVPKENLLGEEGKGFYYLMEFFNRTRAAVGALGVGTAQGALDKAISHVRQRKQFGRPLAAFDSVQHKIAEMATLVEAARSLVWRAASEIDRGNVDPALIAIAKWYACEVAVRVADEAVQLHGGYGILEEYDVAHYYRDAKVLEIFEGTKEIEKILIARRLLGRY
ncbi:MAG: acyl-CoA dehydrogenase [Deltaproteobacteria bacterium]|nr:MAG: acyl-CoA dehydrogenase [Deltaproteobacteria bacterium]